MDPQVSNSPRDEFAGAALSLKPGRDFIELQVGLIESTADGRIKAVRNADGSFSLPAAPLRFGEELSSAAAKIGGAKGSPEFLTLIEDRSSMHRAFCVYRAPTRESNTEGKEWVVNTELIKNGDPVTRRAIRAWRGDPACEQPSAWNGGPSRFDELAGRRYTGLGVGAIILNRRDEVLLGQRGPAVRQEAGLWDFPGGGVELGQLTIEALHREIGEEHGIAIQHAALAGIIDHRLKTEGTHWISATYICRTDAIDARVLEQDKCLQARFFKASEIHALPLTACTRKSLALLSNYSASRRA